MILLQIITALFAVACAWLNQYPVMLMRAYWVYGSHRKQERAFHAANAVVKVLWAVTWAMQYLLILRERSFALLLIFSLLLLLIQWLVFDPALNLFTEKPWFYSGQTAFLDRLVKNGKIKAAVILAVIVALNLLL